MANFQYASLKLNRRSEPESSASHKTHPYRELGFVAAGL